MTENDYIEDEYDDPNLFIHFKRFVTYCESHNINSLTCYKTLILGSLLLPLTNNKSISSKEEALKFTIKELFLCYKAFIDDAFHLDDIINGMLKEKLQ